MQRFLPVFLFLFLISGTHQQGKSVDDLIKELFKNENSTAATPKIPDRQGQGQGQEQGGQGQGQGGQGQLPDPNKCVCVPYYLCTNEGVLNTKGEGIIDIRADEGLCESYLDVCCNSGNVTEKPIEPEIPVTFGCGWRNADGVGFRITGDTDNEAKFGEFPWMAAIIDEETHAGSDEVLNKYQCGGSLIHPQAIITAAHCVSDTTKRFKVRVGEWDTQTSKEIFPHQERYVKSVTIHPQYYAGAVLNDIAFLLLESPVNVSYSNIGVACLPTQGAIIPAGTRCFATGWGKDKFSAEGKYQVILKKIDLPIVDRDTCQNNLRTTRLGRFFQLDKSFICAGGEKGKDTCKGDGGSPLVCPIPGQKGRYQQVGIVAWGIGCGENQIPGVYVNVALFRDWINEEAAYNNLGTTAYEY